MCEQILVLIYLFQIDKHHPKVTVEFMIDGETVTLDLIKNMELFAKDHVLAFQKNGKTILHRPSPKVRLRHIVDTVRYG